ncbi:MAG TPA: flagellar assembly protein FliW [Candidatus Binatia bacterium]|nr:flagellar assembly protein FliW [Candidatus Binatia bacterium]
MESTAEQLDEPRPGPASPAPDTIRVESRRVGVLDVPRDKVFTIARGLIGLPAARRFVLVDHRPGSLFRWLLCVDDPELAFVVADPATVVAAYQPPLEQAASALGCAVEDLVTMVLVTIPADPRDVSVNLLAPIAVDAARRVGVQLVVEGADLDTAHRIRPPA